MGGAVARFAVVSVVAIVVLGAVGVTIMRRTGTSEAIREAKQVTRLVGRGTVEPRVTTAARVAGDRARSSTSIAWSAGRVLRDPIVRVKIWTRDGRIVYSDEPRLIGARVPARLGPAQARSGPAGSMRTSATCTRRENRFERSHGKLLEVYMPIRSSNGRPLLFEAYQRFSSINDSGRHLWLSFTPALLGALLVLGLLQLPLAWSMARRLRQGQEEREACCGRRSRHPTASAAGSRGCCTTGSCRSSPASRTRCRRRPSAPARTATAAVEDALRKPRRRRARACARCARCWSRSTRRASTGIGLGPSVVANRASGPRKDLRAVRAAACRVEPYRGRRDAPSLGSPLLRPRTGPEEPQSLDNTQSRPMRVRYLPGLSPIASAAATAGALPDGISMNTASPASRWRASSKRTGPASSLAMQGPI